MEPDPILVLEDRLNRAFPNDPGSRFWAKDSYTIARRLTDVSDDRYGYDLVFTSEREGDPPSTMWVFGTTSLVEVTRCTVQEERSFIVRGMPPLSWKLCAPSLRCDSGDSLGNVSVEVIFEGGESRILSSDGRRSRFLYECVIHHLAR